METCLRLNGCVRSKGVTKESRRNSTSASSNSKNFGWEMTRPHSDTLRDGIHELRVGFGGVNYRLLYAFHGQTVAVLAHGLTKERAVPPEAIDLALRRSQVFAADPKKHTHIRDA